MGPRCILLTMKRNSLLKVVKSGDGESPDNYGIKAEPSSLICSYYRVVSNGL